MTATLNNSSKYSSTRLAPTEVLFGFKNKELLDLLRIEALNIDDLWKQQSLLHKCPRLQLPKTASEKPPAAYDSSLQSAVP